MELMMEHLNHGMWLTLMLSLPVVLLAAGIGLIIGILQAVTQVQEQTISAAPKILGVFLLLILGGGVMMTMMSNYIRESLFIAFNQVPQDGIFILPPRPKTTNQQHAMMFFKDQLHPNGDTGKAKAFFEQPTPAIGGGNSNSVVLQGRKAPPQAGIGEKLYLKNKDH